VIGSLTDRVLNGEVPAIARLITRAETGAEGAEAELAELHRRGGRAWIVGVTGASGSGKSTLVGALTSELRKRGETVGIVAVDPTSPYSGGAILGDRIRLGDVAADPGVYIRSMATRGALGGLARATYDAITILDAAGKDWILVETVGVGQDEVDIATTAHTTLVVTVPGLGDDIQALKAGVVEIADLQVVNKADREGADRTAMELRAMLNLGKATPPGGRKPPVLKVVAASGTGVRELAAEIARHREWLRAGGRLVEREREMARRRIATLAQRILSDSLRQPDMGTAFETAVEAVRTRQTDPVTAARRLIAESRN
jgi:LAO/AO transport system kinase